MISKDPHGECKKRAWDMIKQEYMYPGGIATLSGRPVAQMPLNQCLCTVASFLEMEWVRRHGESGEGGRLDVGPPRARAEWALLIVYASVPVQPLP